MKRILMLLLVLTLFVPLANATVPEADAYNSALELYNAQKFDQARTELEDFLKNFPDSKYQPLAMLKLADMTEDKETAIANYNIIINKYPGTDYEAEALYSLGRLYYSQEDYPQARENFQSLIEKHNDSAWIEQAYYYMMSSLNALNNYDETAKYFSEYDKNKNFNAYRNRASAVYGDSLYEKGDMAGAAKIYADVIKNYTEKDETLYIPAVYKRVIDADQKTGKDTDAGALIAELKTKYPDSKEAKELSGNMAAEPTATAAPVAEAKADTTQAVAPVKITAAAAPVAEAKVDTTQAVAPVKITATAALAEKTVSASPIAEAKTSTVAAEQKPYFTVQVAAYTSEKWANVALKKLEKKGVTAKIVKEGKFIKLFAGEYATRAEAIKLSHELANKDGIGKVYVREIK